MFDIIEIWMATKIKSTGDMSWSNLLTVKRTHPLFNWMSFLADRENKVIVYPTKYKNSSTCLHFVGTDEYIRVDHHDVGSESSLPGRCDPTLVQIQRGPLGLGTWKAPMTWLVIVILIYALLSKFSWYLIKLKCMSSCSIISFHTILVFSLWYWNNIFGSLIKWASPVLKNQQDHWGSFVIKNLYTNI